jgi:hypothetical protein
MRKIVLSAHFMLYIYKIRKFIFVDEQKKSDALVGRVQTFLISSTLMVKQYNLLFAMNMNMREILV